LQRGRAMLRVFEYIAQSLSHWNCHLIDCMRVPNVDFVPICNIQCDLFDCCIFNYEIMPLTCPIHSCSFYKLEHQQIWDVVVDFSIYTWSQLISVCNSERINQIGQYLPKLCSNEKGQVFLTLSVHWCLLVVERRWTHRVECKLRWAASLQVRKLVLCSTSKCLRSLCFSCVRTSRIPTRDEPNLTSTLRFYFQISHSILRTLQHVLFRCVAFTWYPWVWRV